jgi:DNA polymerase-1
MPTFAGHEVAIQDGNQAIYNGFDCALTFEIDQHRQSLGRNDTLIYDFERQLQAPVLEMMQRGFRVDISEREKSVGSFNQSREATGRILRAIVEATNQSFDSKLPNSPKQLQELFYDSMKLRPIETHRSGETKRPMNRETLEKLQTQSPWAETLINAILLYRDQAKSLQVLETEIDNDWRWRCSYNIGGTTTGRFSSSKSPFGTGNNFQNITEQLRRVFIPDPGFKLYGIDKAQSEARDVGWFCGIVLGDWSYLDACESGDLHTYVTRLVYPDWDWTGDLRKDRQIAERRFYRLFTFRDASKRLGHGTNYLGSPAELSRQIRIPLPLVKEFQARYFEAFPCIAQMHQWIAQQIQRERYLVNSFGRRRDIFDRPDTNDTLKAAVAYMFQSATGDALNLGMLRLWYRFRGGPIQLLSQLHDAVYFQMPVVPEKEEKDLLTQALNCVQITQTCRERTMTIPGEIVGGFNWGHKYRLQEDGSRVEWNPKGLVGIRL